MDRIIEIKDNRLPDWLKEEVDRKVNSIIGEEDYLGRCHRFWAVKKQILRDEYGVDWKTPSEEYPTIIFD